MIDKTPAERPVLTVIIPVYNEENTISEILQRVLHVLPPGTEIVVVNDGSRDHTADALREFLGCPQVVLLTQETNQGKGMAIRRGLEVATGEFVIVQDADLEYDPREISGLLAPLINGESDVVYGSRYLNTGARQWSRLIHETVIELLNLSSRWLYGLRLTDEATCYKAFRREDLLRMNLECCRFEFCPEVTAKAGRLGLKIVERPISYKPRTTLEGKKIRWTDGLSAFQTLWHYRHWGPPAK